MNKRLISYLLNIVLLTANQSLAISAEEARLTLPAGQLKNFALSKDASTLSQNYPKYLELSKGNPTYIVPKPIMVGDGFAKLYVESQQMKLSIPLGWLMMETLVGAWCMTPDQNVQIILHSGAGRSFSELRKNAINEMRGKVPQNNLKIKQLNIENGGFAIEVHEIPWHCKSASLLRVFIPHPNKQTEFKFISLQCPEGQLPKYEPLLGSMIKSLSIDWDYKQTSKAYLKTAVQEDKCALIAKKTILSLIKDDSKTFASVISPKVLTAMGGPSKFRLNFEKDAGFMNDVVLPPVSSDIRSYLNPLGQKGFAFTYIHRTTTEKLKQVDLTIVIYNGELKVSGLSLGFIGSH